MKRIVSALMVVSLGFAQVPGGASPATRAVALPDVPVAMSGAATQEIFFAILEGLYRDGVENDVVDKILERDPKSGYPVNFVYACPLCHPVLDAMALYRGRPRFYGMKGDPDTFGSGLAAEVRRQILEGDLVVRQSAIQALCQGWIKRRLDGLAWSAEQRARFAMEMEIGRKNGMAQLARLNEADAAPSSYRAMKFCPSCEAANGACGR